MKSFIFLISFFLIQNAMSSDISQLQYLPKKGTLVFNAGIETGSGKDKVDIVVQGSKNIELYETEKSELRTNFGVGYSFSSRIFVKASVPIILFNEQEKTYQRGSTIEGQKFRRKNKGYGDFTTSIKYRISTKIHESKAFWDTTLSFSPKTGKRKYSSTTKEGNEKRGGSAYSLLLEFGKKEDRNSFLFFINLKRFSKTTGFDLFDYTDVKTGSNASTSLGAKLQSKIKETISLELEGEYGALTDLKIENLGMTTVLAQRAFLSLMAGLNIELIENKLLWKIQARQNFSSYDREVSSLVWRAQKRLFTVNSNLIYQFN